MLHNIENLLILNSHVHFEGIRWGAAKHAQVLLMLLQRNRSEVGQGSGHRRTMDSAIAPRSHGLHHGRCTSRLLFSLSAFNALNISTTTWCAGTTPC